MRLGAGAGPPIPHRSGRLRSGKLRGKRVPSGAWIRPSFSIRVARARSRQLARLHGSPDASANAEMGSSDLRRHCRAPKDVARLLQRALDRLGLSARAYHRILKVARTIADLDGSDSIIPAHAAEAVQYRGLDRQRL